MRIFLRYNWMKKILVTKTDQKMLDASTRSVDYKAYKDEGKCFDRN